MDKKVVTKKVSGKKTAEKRVSVHADPFAEKVDSPGAKKRVAKTVTTAAAKETTKKKPVKPVVKKAVAPAIEVLSDAFAEPITASSPVVKKASKRPATAAKAAVKTAATPAKKKPETKTINSKKADLDVTVELAAAEPDVKVSPVFRGLADVALPELEREDRARLLMQSPTRLYFYWSVRENPWQQLKAIFGDDLGSYTLVLKLTDVKRDAEEIHPCEAEGNWWFDVEPDGEYQAEIGFYATNRPYFRVIYSNTITTPRRNPSPHPASDAKWTVSANKFAEVLDVAGFSRDAFDVAMAGDDHAGAENTTHAAFSRFIGTRDNNLDSVSAEDIRYAMLALASGFTLEELRFRVGPALFAILQANVEKLGSDKAMSALSEYFDIDQAEWNEEEFGSAVYGASLIHFPKALKTKKLSSAFSPRYNPVSSHSIR